VAEQWVGKGQPHLEVMELCSVNVTATNGSLVCVARQPCPTQPAHNSAFTCANVRTTDGRLAIKHQSSIIIHKDGPCYAPGPPDPARLRRLRRVAL
jgi:hypothetical protein